MKKKVLMLFLSIVMVLTMMPTLAFADATPSVHKWVYSDWNKSSGSVTKDAEDNVLIMRGSAERNTDNSFYGPYAWDDQSLKDGPTVTDVNVYIDPAATGRDEGTVGAFGMSVSVSNKQDQYLTELLTDFRTNGAGEVIVSAYDKSNIGKLTEAGVYTLQWTFSAVPQGEGLILYGKFEVLKNGAVKIASDNFVLNDYSDGTYNGPDDLKVGYVWFNNIDLNKDLRLFTDVPSEKTFQTPYKFEANDWVLGDYGDVEVVDADNDIYLLKGGELWESPNPPYATAPYSKKGNQSFNDGNLVHELNAYVNIADEESYVDNGVKFAIYSDLRDRDGNRVTEMTYSLQKDGNKVVVMGTDIEIKKSGVYTFRIEYSRDIEGVVYGQLKVLKDCKEIGHTEKAKMSDLDASGTNHNTAAKHGYLWVSSLNLKDGLKVYKNVPPVIELDKTEISIEEGKTAEIKASLTPADTPDNKIVWASKDESIATVKDGVVTAVKAGTTTIEAKTNMSDVVKCTVKVTEKVVPPVVYTASAKVATLPIKVKQSFDVYNNINLMEGDSIASVASSNTKYATVSGTVVKAGKKKGSTTITVTTAKGASTSFVLKVQKSKVKGSSVTIGIANPITLNAGQSVAIGATKNVCTCKAKIKYSSSKKKVAKVSKSGVITAKKAGKATITVRCGNKKTKIKVTVI